MPARDGNEHVVADGVHVDPVAGVGGEQRKGGGERVRVRVGQVEQLLLGVQDGVGAPVLRPSSGGAGRRRAQAEQEGCRVAHRLGFVQRRTAHQQMSERAGAGFREPEAGALVLHDDEHAVPACGEAGGGAGRIGRPGLGKGVDEVGVGVDRPGGAGEGAFGLVAERGATGAGVRAQAQVAREGGGAEGEGDDRGHGRKDHHETGACAPAVRGEARRSPERAPVVRGRPPRRAGHGASSASGEGRAQTGAISASVAPQRTRTSPGIPGPAQTSAHAGSRSPEGAAEPSPPSAGGGEIRA